MINKNSFATTVISVIIALGLLWGLTCCVLFLIALCFDITITLKSATGVWLMLLLISFYTKHRSKK